MGSDCNCHVPEGNAKPCPVHGGETRRLTVLCDLTCGHEVEAETSEGLHWCVLCGARRKAKFWRVVSQRVHKACGNPHPEGLDAFCEATLP